MTKEEETIKLDHPATLDIDRLAKSVWNVWFADEYGPYEKVWESQRLNARDYAIDLLAEYDKLQEDE